MERLCICGWPRLNLLNEKCAQLMGLSCFGHSASLVIVHADYLAILDDNKLAIVFLHQLRLIGEVVVKLGLQWAVHSLVSFVSPRDPTIRKDSRKLNASPAMPSPLTANL